MPADVYRVPERVAVPPAPAVPPPLVEDDLEYVNCAVGVANPWMVWDDSGAASARATLGIAAIGLSVGGLIVVAWYLLCLSLM